TTNFCGPHPAGPQKFARGLPTLDTSFHLRLSSFARQHGRAAMDHGRARALGHRVKASEAADDLDAGSVGQRYWKRSPGTTETARFAISPRRRRRARRGRARGLHPARGVEEDALGHGEDAADLT